MQAQRQTKSIGDLNGTQGKWSLGKILARPRTTAEHQQREKRCLERATDRAGHQKGKCRSLNELLEFGKCWKFGQRSTRKTPDTKERKDFRYIFKLQGLTLLFCLFMQ